MRHRPRLHKVFEPTRLSEDHLHHTYELIVAPVQREVRREAAPAGQDVLRAVGKNRRREGKAV